MRYCSADARRPSSLPNRPAGKQATGLLARPEGEEEGKACPWRALGRLPLVTRSAHAHHPISLLPSLPPFSSLLPALPSPRLRQRESPLAHKSPAAFPPSLAVLVRLSRPLERSSLVWAPCRARTPTKPAGGVRAARTRPAHPGRLGRAGGGGAPLRYSLLDSRGRARAGTPSFCRAVRSAKGVWPRSPGTARSGSAGPRGLAEERGGV